MNMNINVNISQRNLFFNGNQNYSAATAYQKKDENGPSLRRILSQNRQQQENSGIVNQILGYSDSVRTARSKAKDASLEVKKLQYNFKSISTQILRSKTSANARQIAGKARREVLRLKRQRQSGAYDDEELQAAIVHAQAMERVAKKKARHLQEEELMKVSGGPCAGETGEDERLEQIEKHSEEKKDTSNDFLQQELGEVSEDRAQAEQKMMQAQQEAFREMMQEMADQMAENLQEEMAASVEDMMSEMMDELWESMEDLSEEMDLTDLAEGMFAPAKEMDPPDFKLMKIKHRSEEMKAISKADAEYLKTVFEHYEKMTGSEASFEGIGTAGTSVGTGAMPGVGFDMSV